MTSTNSLLALYSNTPAFAIQNSAAVFVHYAREQAFFYAIFTDSAGTGVLLVEAENLIY
jgi:hypothetical protein